MSKCGQRASGMAGSRKSSSVIRTPSHLHFHTAAGRDGITSPTSLAGSSLAFPGRTMMKRGLASHCVQEDSVLNCVSWGHKHTCDQEGGAAFLMSYEAHMVSGGSRLPLQGAAWSPQPSLWPNSSRWLGLQA